MKLLLITLIALSLNAKELDCSKLLKRSVKDLNKSHTSKRIDRTVMFATRSLAMSNMYKICVETNEDYNIKNIRKMLRMVK